LPALYLVMLDYVVPGYSLFAFPDFFLTDFFFRGLKINHDSHEFILEFGTVANMTNYLFNTSSVNVFKLIMPNSG
jgi:hypothetical protein